MFVILDQIDVLEAMNRVGVASEMYSTLENLFEFLGIYIEDINGLLEEDIPKA